MGRPFRYTGEVMATIRLKKIVDYRGVVYGPGQIDVSDQLAEIFVKYYNAERVGKTASPSEPPAAPVTTADVIGATVIDGQTHVIAKDKSEPAGDSEQSESGEALPEDFPAREKLAQAGVSTWEQLKACQNLPEALTAEEKDLVNLELAVKYEGKE